MNCIECGEHIPEKREKLKYDTCVTCSTEQKYVARRQGKHGDIDIMRTNQDWFKKSIRRENKVGFNANLPINSTTNPKG